MSDADIRRALAMKMIDVARQLARARDADHRKALREYLDRLSRATPDQIRRKPVDFTVP